MSGSLLLLVTVALPAAGDTPPAGETLRLENARLRELAAQDDLERILRSLRSLLPSAEDPSWVAWSVPAVAGEQRICGGGSAEAVPLLLRLARRHERPEVRKAAIFWLGQSGDPRALALFEEILDR